MCTGVCSQVSLATEGFEKHELLAWGLEKQQLRSRFAGNSPGIE